MRIYARKEEMRLPSPGDGRSEAQQISTPCESFDLLDKWKHDLRMHWLMDEKVGAFTTLQPLFFTGAFGFTTPDIASKSVGKAVRAKRRRLLGRKPKQRALALWRMRLPRKRTLLRINHDRV